MTALAPTESALVDAQPDTEWESLVSEGQAALERQDRERWNLGDCAVKVVKRYKENAIGKYAGEVQVNVATLRGYERVSAFWTKREARAAFENLSWSHYRLAMELGTQRKAFRFLRACSDESLTVAASVRLLRTMQKRPVPPRKLFDGVLVVSWAEKWRLQLGGAGVAELDEYQGKRVQVIIREVIE